MRAGAQQGLEGIGAAPPFAVCLKDLRPAKDHSFPNFFDVRFTYVALEDSRPPVRLSGKGISSSNSRGSGATATFSEDKAPFFPTDLVLLVAGCTPGCPDDLERSGVHSCLALVLPRDSPTLLVYAHPESPLHAAMRDSCHAASAQDPVNGGSSSSSSQQDRPRNEWQLRSISNMATALRVWSALHGLKSEAVTGPVMSEVLGLDVLGKAAQLIAAMPSARQPSQGDVATYCSSTAQLNDSQRNAVLAVVGAAFQVQGQQRLQQRQQDAAGRLQLVQGPPGTGERGGGRAIICKRQTKKPLWTVFRT